MDMSELKKTIVNKHGLYPNVDNNSTQPLMEQPSNYPSHTPQVGSKSCTTVCPACHSKVQTKVTYETGKKTHLLSFLYWSCFMFCGCCLPYCINSCKNAEHSCPNCGNFIGICDK